MIQCLHEPAVVALRRRCGPPLITCGHARPSVDPRRLCHASASSCTRPCQSLRHISSAYGVAHVCVSNALKMAAPAVAPKRSEAHTAAGFVTSRLRGPQQAAALTDARLLRLQHGISSCTCVAFHVATRCEGRTRPGHCGRARAWRSAAGAGVQVQATAVHCCQLCV